MLQGRQVRVLTKYVTQYANPLQVLRGEALTVGREDDEFPGWRWCKFADGREGWVPEEFLSSRDTQATILCDYSAKELSVEPGELLRITDTPHDWVLVPNSQGEAGWVPASHIEKPDH